MNFKNFTFRKQFFFLVYISSLEEQILKENNFFFSFYLIKSTFGIIFFHKSTLEIIILNYRPPVKNLLVTIHFD